MATINLVEAIKKDNGWYEGKTDTGIVLSTKKPEIGEVLLASIGKQAEAEWTTKTNGTFENHFLDKFQPLANGSSAPAFGTGDYIKGKENPDTQRSIIASVALREAVAAFTHTVTPAMTPKDASARIIPLADSFFLWGLRKAGLVTEEDIPF